MNDEDIKSHCSCWSVKLPERPEDFAGVRSCCEARECACRHRVLGTVVIMLVFAGVGAAIGLTGARREDSKNLATLRETHLHSIGIGGDE